MKHKITIEWDDNGIRDKQAIVDPNECDHVMVCDPITIPRDSNHINMMRCAVCNTLWLTTVTISS